MMLPEVEHTWQLYPVNKAPSGAVLRVDDGIQYLPPEDLKELEEQCKAILGEKEG